MRQLVHIVLFVIASCVAEIAVCLAQAHSDCRKPCLDLSQKRGPLFVVAFGYKDAAPARFVGDRHERAYLIQRILKPCSGEVFACGFVRSPEDADLFIKEMKGRDGEARRVALWVIHSAAGTDDRDNRSNPFQKWQSEYAEARFGEALRVADAVFYNGHSRDGGGPDFRPPRLATSGHPDYAWYRSRESGIRNLIRNLQRPKILGLFSCASSTLFLKKLQMNHSNLGVISTPKLLYYADALESTYQALDAVLGMKCDRLGFGGLAELASPSG